MGDGFKTWLLLILIGCVGCQSTEFGSTSERNGGNKSARPDGSGGKDSGDDGDDTSDGNDGDDGKDQIKLGQDEQGGGEDVGSGGGNGKKKEDEIETDGEVSKCIDKKLKTKVRLLTTLVSNGVPGNHITYEISVVDCNGRHRPVSAESIHFDIDAEVDDAVVNTYRATVGTEVKTGTLQVVEGQDLFGKTGAEYFHHKTDQTMKTTEKTSAVTFKVDLGGQSFYPFNGGGGKTFVVNTHLRFGDADPVTMPVAFLGL